MRWGQRLAMKRLGWSSILLLGVPALFVLALLVLRIFG